MANSVKGRVIASTGFATETLLKSTEVFPPRVIEAFRRSLGTLQTPQEMLWREVVARAVLDAWGITPECQRPTDGMRESRFRVYCRTIAEARLWLTGSDAEATPVDEAFTAANVDWAPVRDCIRDLGPVKAPAFFGHESRARRVAAGG